MKYIFANWKMYLDFAESCILANRLITENIDENKIHLGVFPNYLAISELVKIFSATKIAVGGQNCAWTPKGAYTGAVSALLLKEAGCQYVLLGHSERRYIFGETDEDIRKKIEAALAVGLTPVVCVGENDDDRKENKREYRLKKQLMKLFADLRPNGAKIIVAYEPVWAIGTGESCSAADADDIHGWIKNELKTYLAHEIPLLYGGSVTAENVVSYVARDMVDGVLVGGASAKYESLAAITRTVDSNI